MKHRLRRLRERVEGPPVSISQQDGTVETFSAHELAPAFVDAMKRSTGRPEGPEHPLCTAARNSSDAAWRDSFYAAGPPEFEVEDLSE